MKGILDTWGWNEQGDVEGKRRKHGMNVAGQVKGGSEAGQRGQDKSLTITALEHFQEHFQEPKCYWCTEVMSVLSWTHVTRCGKTILLWQWNHWCSYNASIWNRFNLKHKGTCSFRLSHWLKKGEIFSITGFQLKTFQTSKYHIECSLTSLKIW